MKPLSPGVTPAQPSLGSAWCLSPARLGQGTVGNAPLLALCLEGGLGMKQLGVEVEQGSEAGKVLTQKAPLNNASCVSTSLTSCPSV